MKITTLIENTQGEHLGLKTEHGLSFHIESESMKLLFDVGQSHYDHSGGLRALLEITDDFQLIMGKGFFRPKFGYRNNCYEYLGNSFDENYLKDRNIDYGFVSAQKTRLMEGIYIITDFCRTNAEETINPRFVLRKDGSTISDAFNDEILLAIETKKGIVVIVGCAHPGVRNMLDTVKTIFNKQIYGVLGGTHLVEASDEALDKAIKYLSNSQIKILGASHCTGEKAMSRLKNTCASYFHNSTGSSVFLDF